jgi:hypothetical protein
MRSGLTWWGWAGLSASVGLIVAVWARHAWRTAVREELVAYLGRAAPGVAVVRVRTACLIVKGRDAGAIERQLALEAFYRDLSARPGGSAEAEAARLEVFAAVARQAECASATDAPLRRAS